MEVTECPIIPYSRVPITGVEDGDDNSNPPLWMLRLPERGVTPSAPNSILTTMVGSKPTRQWCFQRQLERCIYKVTPFSATWFLHHNEKVCPLKITLSD